MNSLCHNKLMHSIYFLLVIYLLLNCYLNYLVLLCFLFFLYSKILYLVRDLILDNFISIFHNLSKADLKMSFQNLSFLFAHFNPPFLLNTYF